MISEGGRVLWIQSKGVVTFGTTFDYLVFSVYRGLNTTQEGLRIYPKGCEGFRYI